jgi:hypothetical protein
MRITDRIAAAFLAAREAIGNYNAGNAYDRWEAGREPRTAGERESFAAFDLMEAEETGDDEQARDFGEVYQDWRDGKAAQTDNEARWYEEWATREVDQETAQHWKEVAAYEAWARENPEAAEADRQASAYPEAWYQHGIGDHSGCEAAGIDDVANPDPRDIAPGDPEWTGPDYPSYPEPRMSYPEMEGPGYTEPPGDAEWTAEPGPAEPTEAEFAAWEEEPESRYVAGREPRDDEETRQFAAWDAKGAAGTRPMTDEERAQAADITRYVTEVMGSPKEAAEVLRGGTWYSSPAEGTPYIENTRGSQVSVSNSAVSPVPLNSTTPVEDVTTTEVAPGMHLYGNWREVEDEGGQEAAP